MSVRKMKVWAPTLGAMIFGAASARAAEPGVDELKQQIDALQQRVRQLETTPTPPTVPVEPAPSDLVAQDAQGRSRVFDLASGGATGGYDKGFFLKSDDGNFLLKPGIQTQFRYVGNYNDGADEDSAVQDGFEVRRLRLRFEGNAFSPKFTYLVQWDTARTNGAVSLLDAWFQYALTPDLALRGGQFKESVFHERDVSGFSQLAVERSLADAVLGGALTDRVQGVALILGGNKDKPYRAEVAFHDGANSRNTNFQDGTSSTANHWGIGGRFEYKLAGDWASYKDFTAKNTKETLFVVGAGADNTDRAGSDVLATTADAQYELADRLALYGALHVNFTDPHDSTDNVSRTDYGALVQAGYLLNERWEVFGRYDVVKLDEDAVAADAEDTFHEVTAGVNYYFGPDGSFLHRAKFSADLTYLPNGAPSDQTAQGVVAGDEEQIVVRAQFQFLL